MTLQKFLSCLVIVAGLLAAFLLYGGLLSSPGELLLSTSNYSPVGWVSAKIIQSIADQQSNLLVSLILLIIMSILQFFAMFVSESKKFKLKTLILFALAVAIGSFFILRLTQKCRQKYISNEIKKEETRRYLSRNYLKFEEKYVNLQWVENITEEYFHLTKTDDMTWKDYIIKISEKVDWTLPSDFDLDNLKETPQ